MLRAGLIGLPQSGKTTLFQLLTSGRDAPRTHGKADANVGVSRVPDDRLDQLTALFNPQRRVPATVELADTVAGRADAASLLDVAVYRTADALLHVVRAFEDPASPHPAGSIDPRRDVQTVEDEVILADLGVVERRLERLARDMRKSATADLRIEQDILERCRVALEAGRALRALGLTGDEARRLRGFQLLSAKPVLLVLNVAEAEAGTIEDVARTSALAERATTMGAGLVGVCARIELEIGALEPADAAAFLVDLGLRQSGLDRIIRAAYELLGYISFFTVGEDECRAWSIPRGTPAQEAAGAIHSDIQRGFIRAEVVACERLLARGSLAACRDHGELRLEGKEYLVADGDVINFRHAT
ncbi:MAG TPA: redox-regulated ATPase YchF [Vicinamibacterales bacterium]|nr:redox-regulated ATPase YchF [Vicinamibacterales bacterium]